MAWRLMPNHAHLTDGDLEGGEASDITLGLN